MRAHDFYFCIKSHTLNEPAQLCVCWRDPKSKKSTIEERTLDPDKDSFSPLSIEMLTGNLSTILQTVLVGVERAISRVSLNNLTFPEKDEKFDEIFSPTNDWSISNKIPSSGSNHKSLKSQKDALELTCSANRPYWLKTNNDDGDCNDPVSNINLQSTKNEDKSQMPFSCMGISFPHIDSDEDSGDDGRKSDSGTDFLQILLISATAIIFNSNFSESSTLRVIVPKRFEDILEKLHFSEVYMPGMFFTTNCILFGIHFIEHILFRYIS